MSDHPLLCQQSVRVPKPSMFSNNFLTAHHVYDTQLQKNCRQLLMRFPSISYHTIKQMLQEFNNDICVVQQLLKEQTKIVTYQSKTVKTFASIKTNYSQQQENKILKKTVASIYVKLKSKDENQKHLSKQNQILRKQNENKTKQIQFLKHRIVLLSGNQFCQYLDQNIDIY